MSLRRPALSKTEAIPTLEEFRHYRTTVVAVGTTAVALPTTNLSARKAIFIQNIHASQTLYVGGSSIPDVIEAPHTYVISAGLDKIATKYNLTWFPSGSGTSEYYAATAAGGDPSLTEPLRMYGITSGSGSTTESLLTNGTVGSLSNLNWDWGNNDTLGFNTIYFRHDSGKPDALRNYLVLLSYTSMPDTSSNYGVKLTAGNAYAMTLGGSARVWGIASGAGTTTIVQEYI